MPKQDEVTLIGGGLVGSLLALFLQNKGFKVTVFEKRSDPRLLKTIGRVGEGRSINLAISVRGFHGLELCGLKEEVQERAIPMTGRMLHQKNGEKIFQAYGQSSEDAIYSFSRTGLNALLIQKAEKSGVHFYFNQEVTHVDLNRKKLKLRSFDHSEQEISFPKLIGTDGSASILRAAIEEKTGVASSAQVLSHGYKELILKAAPHAQFLLDKNCLHIWPRGPFMLIALPNEDGSFTCTLFLPLERTIGQEHSFEALQKDENIEAFFQNYFQDFCTLVPDYKKQFLENPVGRMVTLKTSQWSDVQSESLLMGDAAHAIVPFFGQGMNCGFEDCVEFIHLLEKYDLKKSNDLQTVFTEFYQRRKINTDAIADLAVENFTEMSTLTANPRFLIEKKIESKLFQLFSPDYIPRYTLVSFSRTPYRIAYEIGVLQKEILAELSENLINENELNQEQAKELIQKKLKPKMDQYKEHIQWN